MCPSISRLIWVIPDNTIGYGGPTASLGLIGSPAETVMIGDGFTAYSSPDAYSPWRGTGYMMGYVIASSGGYFPALRHNDTANIGFVDGHAKAENMGYLSDNTNWDLQ